MCKVSIIVPVYNVEKYIEDMLMSVQYQTMTDFEVIVVNDGSTDGSQRIIDSFCREDERFHSFVKANGGVASARNMGIEKASGECVVFYDPDDIIPHDSLEKMYGAACGEKADMVVGVMAEYSLGERLIYMHSQKLAKQKNIDPLDRHFFGAWSICNKMFSLEFLRKYKLRVEKMSNAEDGVFTFCALNHAGRICGCDAIAYEYIKRPFWENPSATQIISSQYLGGLLDSHDRILQEAERLADRHQLSSEERADYLEPLYVRFVEGEMINGYYRGIWRATEDLIGSMSARTAQYREHISKGEWERLVGRHKDIGFDGTFMTAAEMVASPKVSLILAVERPSRDLNLMLGSIYSQLFPRFEVLVPVEAYGKIDDLYRRKMNLRVIDSRIGSPFKNEALAAAKGEYVMLLNEFVLFTKNSLRQMVLSLMRDGSIDFVSMLMKRFDGKKYEQIPVLSASYGYTKRGRRSNGKLTGYDTFFSNKLLRKAVLSGFSFGDDAAKDVNKMYQSLNFEKLRKGVMITDLSDEDIIRRSGMKAAPLSVKVGFRKNEAIRNLTEKMKRHITREDIDKIKEKLGR